MISSQKMLPIKALTLATQEANKNSGAQTQEVMLQNQRPSHSCVLHTRGIDVLYIKEIRLSILVQSKICCCISQIPHHSVRFRISPNSYMHNARQLA
jgi:hypothetical protein